MVGQGIRKNGQISAAICKRTWRENLTKQELEETLMDIEIVLNNHKSIHIEGGIQLSVLTQNTLFYG